MIADRPELSVIIPTRDRPGLLRVAVASALAQTVGEIEVVIVDDASAEPVPAASHPRVRVVRFDDHRGGAAARNAGAAAARGRWLAYLDDDDTLLPTMAAQSLDALRNASKLVGVPGPVTVLSGLQVVDADGRQLSTRIPPPLRRRGSHFSLEPLELGCSYGTKQTMVVERDLLCRIGWDESFRSRVHTELFLRLNQESSIIGLPVVTYRLTEHSGTRMSTDPERRRESLRRLEHKHADLLHSHRSGYADLLLDDAKMLLRCGRTGDALTRVAQAIRARPHHALPLAVRLAGSRRRRARDS